MCQSMLWALQRSMSDAMCYVLRASQVALVVKKSESESRSVVSNSLWPHGLYSPQSSPGQNTGVGSLSLLQGIFPTQGPNPCLLHCRQILYQLSPQGRAHLPMQKTKRDGFDPWGGEDSLKEHMTTLSSILAWRIPRPEDPGKLQPIGWQSRTQLKRLSTDTHTHTHAHTVFPGGSVGELSACNGGDPGSIPGLGRSSGEDNANPLQYSCLENSMDRGAWWVTVHGVTKIQTWLSVLHTHTHTHIHTHQTHTR